MPVLGNASTAVLDGATSPYSVSRVVTDLFIYSWGLVHEKIYGCYFLILQTKGGCMYEKQYKDNREC